MHVSIFLPLFLTFLLTTKHVYDFLILNQNIDEDDFFWWIGRLNANYFLSADGVERFYHLILYRGR